MKAILVLSFLTMVWGECLNTEVCPDSWMEDDDEVEVAREAYIYFYPILVFMSQLFDEAVWPHTPDYLAMNTFGHQLQSLDWTYAAVTDPSVDHLYSQAWLDLGRYPVVLNIPDIPEQRYYGVTIVDGYGIIIKVICPRTREGSWEADQYVIVGPGFTGSLPSHFDDDHIIQSLSHFIFIISRNEVHGSDDVPNVRAIQNGYTLASLDGNELPKITPLVFPYVVSEELAKPTPEPQIFFSHANFIINSMAIEGSESDLFKRFAKIEVGPATEFIGQRMSQPMYRNIQDGIANGSESIVDAHAADIAKVRNGWITLLESQVVHTDYLGRAVNAMFAGLYISDPEEAMFHSGSEDIDGHALDSTKYDYMLTFAPGQFPPVAEQYGGFWSVTVYLGPGWGPQRKLGSLVHNPIDRYAVNGRTTPGLVYDANGALTLYIQKTRPDTDAKAANWLPTPDPEFGGYETGEFHLLLRAYVPEDIEYIPPAIVKIGPATSIRNMHIP